MKLPFASRGKHDPNPRRTNRSGYAAFSRPVQTQHQEDQSAPRRRTGEPSMGAALNSGRLAFVFVLLIFAGLATAVKLVAIQVFQHRKYDERAQIQYTHRKEIEPERGSIIDRRGRLLVDNLKNYGNVGVRPRAVEDPQGVALRLAGELSIPSAEIFTRIQGGSEPFTVARKIEPGLADQIQSLQLPGVVVDREMKRSYPYGPVAGQVIGHVTTDNTGGAGIEKTFERVLAGQPGWAVWQRDARGNVRYDPAFPREEPVDGGQVVLAIDIDAQAIAEEELAKAVELNNATGGIVVITRPMTGEILALASWPGYDPNLSQSAPPSHQKNRAFTDVFEPGSTFKIVTYAAILERNLVQLEDVIDCENGAWRVANRVIHDSHAYSSLTVAEGFAKSSNILTGKLASLMSEREFYTVMRDFGFGQDTGLDIIGEVGGLLPEPHRWSGVTQANMAMGQGVAVTGVQLAMAYGAIANGGWLLRPMLVLSADDPEGNSTRYSPTRVRRVMMPSTSRIIRKLMVQAVEDGTGGRAKIEGVTVAGKTGTAQKVDFENGGYLKGRYISSFCGFLPAERPEWLAIVIIDDPRGGLYYGGSVAGPVFQTIMQRLLVTLPRMEPEYFEGGEDPRALATGQVLVPSLLAMSPDEAEASLANHGIAATFEGQGEVVVAQDAPPGRRARAGETIILTCGSRLTGDETMPTPDVRTLPLREAVAALTRSGLRPEIDGHGVVIDQYPPAGAGILPGEACLLIARPVWNDKAVAAAVKEAEAVVAQAETAAVARAEVAALTNQAVAAPGDAPPVTAAPVEIAQAGVTPPGTAARSTSPGGVAP